MEVVSERLRHSRIQITADTYSRVMLDMQQEAISGLDSALVGCIMCRG